MHILFGSLIYYDYICNNKNSKSKIMITKLLFIITFIFGVIQLLTWTKIFSREINGFFETLYWKNIPVFLKWLDIIIFLISLGYQINYWLL